MQGGGEEGEVEVEVVAGEHPFVVLQKSVCDLDVDSLVYAQLILRGKRGTTIQ